MGIPSKKAVDANGVTAESARQAVQTLLRYIGENPSRDGLIETPDRYCRALLEMTEGYMEDPATILNKTFEAEADEMVVLKNIEFSSVCEHHLLQFTGKAHVAYLPANGKIVGLSKLARVVEAFARRLQVQERLTQQIANAISTHLQPRGVAVVIEAAHSCMCVRGVRKQNSMMITSSMLGDFRTLPATRSELMCLLNTK